jgi:hypothetical protein
MDQHDLDDPPLEQVITCTRERLAHGPVASVEVCTCGTLHLRLGALTMRFSPEALASVRATLGAATEAYAARFGRALSDGPENDPLASAIPRGHA